VDWLLSTEMPKAVTIVGAAISVLAAIGNVLLSYLSSRSLERSKARLQQELESRNAEYQQDLEQRSAFLDIAHMRSQTCSNSATVRCIV
jgi:hypothetical protein